MIHFSEPALNTILNTSKLGQVELQFNVGTSLALMSSGPFSEVCNIIPELILPDQTN